MNFEQLMHEHDVIDMHTRRLEECCVAEQPAIDVIMATRRALKDVVEDHLDHEDEAIYAGLMAANKHSAAAVDAFNTQFAQLRSDWSTYLDDWNPECLAADWDSFRQETASLMARMRDRTRQETTLLYPLALQTGAIALRRP